jgi:hypothetical protein
MDSKQMAESNCFMEIYSARRHLLSNRAKTVACGGPQGPLFMLSVLRFVLFVVRGVLRACAVGLAKGGPGETLARARRQW